MLKIGQMIQAAVNTLLPLLSIETQKQLALRLTSILQLFTYR